MKKKGTRTLLLSVIMSAPGPLVLGIGLLSGQSSTQVADFIRRSIELFAIVMSFAAYLITVKRGLDERETARIEKRTNLFVAGTMMAAGGIMFCVTLFFSSPDKGNVIFGFIIALLGLIANTIFWFRYRYLARLEGSAILDVQSRLYRAKSGTDLCVTAALLSLLIAPLSPVSYYLDMVGSLTVSLYLVYSGVKIIIDHMRNRKTEI